jgi:hypothetical protein
MGIDWEQEFARLKREAEELVASGVSKEAGILAGGALFARMLLRTGAWVPESSGEVDIVFAAFGGDIVGYELGPPVIRYGPCYLHPMTLLGKDDSRTFSERYVIMLGVAEMPIVVMLDYARQQQRAPANPREIGWIDAATSELTDVARYLRRTVIRSRARVAYDREWQLTHPDQAADHEEAIAIAERRAAMCQDGLREFEGEYGAVLAAPEANLSADEREREVDEVRRSMAIMSDLQDYGRAQQSPPTSEAESGDVSE